MEGGQKDVSSLLTVRYICPCHPWSIVVLGKTPKYQVKHLPMFNQPSSAFLRNQAMPVCIIKSIIYLLQILLFYHQLRITCAEKNIKV